MNSEIDPSLLARRDDLNFRTRREPPTPTLPLQAKRIIETGIIMTGSATRTFDRATGMDRPLDVTMPPTGRVLTRMTVTRGGIILTLTTARPLVTLATLGISASPQNKGALNHQATDNPTGHYKCRTPSSHHHPLVNRGEDHPIGPREDQKLLEKKLAPLRKQLLLP